MPNTLAGAAHGFNDAAQLLQSIYNQATGKSSIAATSLADFISVANTTLTVGTDPLLNAISQVLSRTIFSIRPYDEHFKGLLADSQKWGNHVRKLKLGDNEFERDQRYYEAASDFWDDGDVADMYAIRKPKPVQLNYYGQNVWQDHVTIFRDQLNVAFSSPDDLMRFTSMIMTNMSNKMAQAREDCARMALNNFIASKNILGTGHVVHLVDEYNTAKGTSYTATTIRGESVWPNFCRWLAGFIMTISDYMTERTQLYQQNLTGLDLNQHTPKNRQKLYLLSSPMNSMITEVLSVTYHDELARIGDFEAVNWWQAPATPDQIKVTPVYISAAGAATTGAAQSMSNVIGVLFDEEAVMTTAINQWSASTPFNPAGGYSNMFWHEGHRYCNDLTEKGVVLLLDEASP